MCKEPIKMLLPVISLNSKVSNSVIGASRYQGRLSLNRSVPNYFLDPSIMIMNGVTLLRVGIYRYGV